MNKILATIISIFVFIFTHYIVKNILLNIGMFVVFITNMSIDDVSGSLYGISITIGFIISFYVAIKIHEKLTSKDSHKKIKREPNNPK